MRWTEQQYEEYIFQTGKDKVKVFVPTNDLADPGPESRLQRKIEAWCKEWGRPCLSLRQSPHAKRLLPAGWPDVVIAMPNGKTLYIELKAKGGRLSQEQKQIALQLMALGHQWHEVKSFRRFMEICNSMAENQQNR